MYKKIILTVFIVMGLVSFTLSAAPNKFATTSALFFQYSYDNDFRQIDSIGMYARVSTDNASQTGGSFGLTFELPLSYDNDKISIKYSLFGGPSLKFKIQGDDTILTIGPSIANTMLADSYYRAILLDMGIFVDLATSYPVSENVQVVVGGSFIFDVARYSLLETASTVDNGFVQDFFQISARMYLGFSVSK